MLIKRQLWDLLHTYVYRDLIGPLAKHKYGSCARGVRIFRPYTYDKHRRNIKIGENSSLGKYSRIQCYPNHQGRIGELTIGANCILGNNVTILCGGDVNIEDNVLIASYVLITSENHSIDPESNDCYMSQPLICKDVRIMHGAWIGERVCVLPGVVIGKKSVIGAGSVVTSNIPDYCIAAGNPAKIIKKYDFMKHCWIKCV